MHLLLTFQKNWFSWRMLYTFALENTESNLKVVALYYNVWEVIIYGILL